MFPGYYQRPASAPPPAKPQPAPRLRYLKETDRCDRCGARAFVAAEIHGVDLLFCGHHFTQWEAAISAAADELIDERWQIEEEERRRVEYHN